MKLHKRKPNDKLHQKIQSFRSDIAEKARTTRLAILDLAAVLASWSYYQCVIAPYFKYWSHKTRVRVGLRYTALAVVTLSTTLLLVEISLELTGHERILSSITRFQARVVAALEQLRAAKPTLFAHLPGSAYLVTVLVLAALMILALYLAWHNIEEARKPGYEYHFARAINSFLLDCRVAHGAGQSIPVFKALEVCHFVFKHAGIQHVSLHLPVQGSLVIRPEHVFPTDPSFSAAILQPGEGLAGQVYEDEGLHIQYLPRMFFPLNFRYGGWLFPHTAKMQFSTVKIKSSSLRLWEVGNEEINPNTFKRIGTEPIRYRSLLSVPVVSVVDKQLVGVLNLDFGKTDPLDKRGIEMALVFALLLGGEFRNGGIIL